MAGKNWRRIAEQSIEREQEWKRQLEASDQRVLELEDLVDAQASSIVNQRRTIEMLQRQGLHVKAVHDALLQRYVGVKLDTQLFTLPQASQFVDNERAALEGALEGISRAVASQAQGVQQGVSPADQEPA